MESIETGDIIFIRGKGILSRIIEFFDGEFSHVCIAVSASEIFEAQYFTVAKTVPFNYKDYCVVRLNLTEKQKEKVRATVKELTGRWYDYTEVIWILLQIIFGKKDIPLWNNPNNLICSEVVAIILEHLGLIKDRKILINCTPNQLYRFVTEKLGGKIYE